MRSRLLDQKICVYRELRPSHQGSTENDAKSNFLRNIYSEQVLTLYSQGAQEMPFKLHTFETPSRLMGKWTNSKISACEYVISACEYVKVYVQSQKRNSTLEACKCLTVLWHRTHGDAADMDSWNTRECSGKRVAILDYFNLDLDFS